MSYYPVNSINKTSMLMSLITARQEALSGNLANIDTPGYVRKDIDFAQYVNSMNSPLETQLSTKMGPSGVIQERQDALTPADELAFMQQNALLYSVAARRMSSTITELKTVLNVGK